MQPNNLNEFSKKAIFKCYVLMKDYLHDDEVESESCFGKMFQEIDKMKIAIPESIYKKITQFMDEWLAPIVYERETCFPTFYSDEVGFYNADGKWEIRDEDGMKKICKEFLLKLLETEDELDSFAMEELYPLLVEGGDGLL